MRIYVAAPYKMMEAAQAASRLIQNAGHVVVSRWINPSAQAGLVEHERAAMDLKDLDEADCLILLTIPYGTMMPGGARHVEFGYSLAKGKRVCFVGDYETIFCHLPQVHCYSTIGAFLHFIEGGKL